MHCGVQEEESEEKMEEILGEPEQPQELFGEYNPEKGLVQIYMNQAVPNSILNSLHQRSQLSNLIEQAMNNDEDDMFEWNMGFLS